MEQAITGDLPQPIFSLRCRAPSTATSDAGNAGAPSQSQSGNNRSILVNKCGIELGPVPMIPV
jgi:hypothetical protein